MKLLLPVVPMLLLAACSSINSIDHLSDANKYASLSPGEFIRQRFFAEYETPVKDSIFDSVATATSALHGKSKDDDPSVINDRLWRRPQQFNNGKGVFWTAYYNDINYGQLTQPASDLAQYCKTHGGQFKNIAPPKEDLFVPKGHDPFDAYLTAYSYQREKLEDAVAEIRTIDSNTAVIAPLSEARKEHLAEIAGIAASMKEEAFLKNWKAYSEAAYYSKTYYMLQKSGGFGSFNCIEPDTTKSWKAIVLPFAFKSQRSGHSVMMRLSISLIEE